MARAIDLVSNALDSLDRMAEELRKVDSRQPLSLKGVLAWGWHAAALLAYARLLPARERLDIWLWDYLEAGEPALEVLRDAGWEEKQRLSHLVLLDILSEEPLPLLKPEFYQGWQDRTTRCRTLRRQAAEVIGASIGADQREDLLLLLAAYHRLVRLPAASELEAEPVLAALPRLLDVMEMLVDGNTDAATTLREAIGRCRAAQQNNPR